MTAADTWGEYRRLILDTLERHEKRLDTVMNESIDIQKSIALIKNDIKVMRQEISKNPEGPPVAPIAEGKPLVSFMDVLTNWKFALVAGVVAAAVGFVGVKESIAIIMSLL